MKKIIVTALVFIFFSGMQCSFASFELESNNLIVERLDDIRKCFSNIDIIIPDLKENRKNLRDEETVLQHLEAEKNELGKIKDHIPFIDYKNLKNLYKDIKMINNGASKICSATILSDRKGVELRDQKIALKICRDERLLGDLVGLLQLERLHKNTPVCPQIYGIYETNQYPGYIELWGTDQNVNRNKAFVLEMECADMNMAELYEKTNKFEDSFLFELYVGFWVSQFHLKTFDRDFSLDNVGVKENIKYMRCYHIDDEIYIIDNCLMPMFLDVEAILISEIFQKKPYINNINYARSQSENGINFLKEISVIRRENTNEQMTIIELLKKHFSNFKKDEKWLDENKDKEIKHFYPQQANFEKTKSFN